MAKRRTVMSEKTYFRYLNEGRGQGEGSEYKPWITIHDFPSRGFSTRILGFKTGRVHHLLSHHEFNYFLILDHSDSVTDIREQFPLRLHETLEIARSLGIRHPYCNAGHFPNVLTTDFLVTLADGTIIARTVKSRKDLNNARVLQKLHIEQRYWGSKSIDWKIVTEDQINTGKARNLSWLRSGISFEELIPDPVLREEILSVFTSLYYDESMSFPSIISTVEEHFSVPAGTSMAAFKHLVNTGLVFLDLDIPVNPGNPNPRRKVGVRHEQ